MSSVMGFVSKREASMRTVAESLDIMRSFHPSGHNGEFGTEIGLLFQGGVVWDWPKSVCSSTYGIAGTTFTKILTRAAIGQTTMELLGEFGLTELKTNMLLAAQTSADMSIDHKYSDQDANLVVKESFSLAVCGFITWVLENTDSGIQRKQLAISKGWQGRDAHIFTNWIEEVGLENACQVPTTTRCVALGEDGNQVVLTAFRRDTRADDHVHKRPGLFMAQDEKSCFFASTTVKALQVLVDPDLMQKIRTVKNNEVVQFRQ